jgi:hypothetical protein
MPKKLAIALLLVFAAYSTWVVWDQGYTGFLSLAWREPWGMQMLLDLTLALVMVLRGLVPHARKRNVTPWPWILATIVLGSVGPLAYYARHGKS